MVLNGTPEGTRTPSLQNRNLTLYPIALRAHTTPQPRRSIIIARIFRFVKGVLTLFLRASGFAAGGQSVGDDLPGVGAGQVREEDMVGRQEGKQDHGSAQSDGEQQEQIRPLPDGRAVEHRRQQEARPHQQDIQPHVKGHGVPASCHMVEISRRQHGAADSQQGQQPGPQAVPPAPPAEEQHPRQEGPVDDLQVLPYALVHRRDEAHSGIGKEIVDKMETGPRQRDGHKGGQKLPGQSRHGCSPLSP